jgi:hypothetical protein
MNPWASYRTDNVKAPGSIDLNRFDVVFLEDEEEVRRPLAEAAGFSFEQAAAVRRFPSYRGQRNYPGLYYAATLDAHVGFESWLERNEAMALDFDPRERVCVPAVLAVLGRSGSCPFPCSGLLRQNR